MTQRQLENKLNWEGKILTSDKYGPYQILEYINNYTVTIKFLNTGYVKNTDLYHIIHNSVRDPYHISIYNFGYIGEGKFTSYHKNIYYKIYKRWSDMIRRCYDPLANHYNRYGGRGITVCEEWRNLQNYGIWEEENCIDSTYVLDKDILIKHNKVYSPQTCCFIPEPINMIFCNINDKKRNLPTGVSKKGKSYIAQIMINKEKVHLGSFDSILDAFNAYRVAKEMQIRNAAEEYKEKISNKVYHALLNYKVEIDD